MLVSGRLLASRGALFPGLSEAGLTPGEVRRAWAALGRGAWSSDRLLAQWARLVEREGRWRAAEHGGYRPVAVDVTGFFRPRLRGCPTKHYRAEAGRALPAIVLGLVVRVGVVAGQRLGLPVAFVRAEPTDPSPRALLRRLVRTAQTHLAADEILVADREFGVGLLQEADVPRYPEPLLLATPLPLDPDVARRLYRDRWPVEQLPLAAKQMIGAERQFVHDPETCQRLPELALLAGACLSYAAATSPAVPTGFWDRRPQPTPGRLRRRLARCPFPAHFPLPARIRPKSSATAQLPTGYYLPRCSPTRRRQARRRAAALAKTA
jgi:hypothetical protein